MRPVHFATTAILLFMTGLLTGCNNGSSDSVKNVAVAAPPPTDGISGFLPSHISGATLTVQDASGREIVIASGRNTNSLGAFNIVFSEFELNAGLQTPLLVVADASGATAICDFDAAGVNDCLTASGGFAAFGETYTLPAGYVLRGMVDVIPPPAADGVRTAIVNITPVSDLATTYALAKSGNNSLTEEAVNLGQQQALGVVEFVTGLSVNGASLNQISPVDLTSATSASSAELALAFYGASLNGQISSTNTAANTYRKILDRMGTSIVHSDNTETNQLTATGSFLSTVISPYLASIAAFQTSLATPSPVLSGAFASRTAIVVLLDQAAANPIAIALPMDPTSGDPLDNGKLFVTRLSDVMGGSLLATNISKFGGTATGAASVYADQLETMKTLTGTEFRQTIIQLDDALAAALASGTTELNGTNVSGALSFDGNTVTMDTATSTISNIQTGISINITIPEGSRSSPSGTGEFSATDIVISVSQTINELTTQQTFIGNLVLTMSAGEGSAAVQAMTFNGSITASSGLGSTANINLSSLSNDTTTSVGTYNSSYDFSDGSTLSMGGSLQTQIDQYVFNANTSTIAVDLQTRVITDMTTNLNVSTDSSGTVTGAVIQRGEVQSGTVDTSGTVFYSDGTVTVLPFPII